MGTLTRWLLTIPVVVACLIYVYSFDARLWVGLTALFSALLLRSIVVTCWRVTGRKPLGLMSTMCLSFVGAASAVLTITYWQATPSLIVVFFTAYISALTCGTAAEILAQVMTWALSPQRQPAD